MEIASVVATVANERVSAFVIMSADEHRSLGFEFRRYDSIEAIRRVHHFLDTLVIGIITEIVLECRRHFIGVGSLRLSVSHVHRHAAVVHQGCYGIILFGRCTRAVGVAHVGPAIGGLTKVRRERSGLT